MTTPVHANTMTGSLAESQAQVMFTTLGWAPPAKLPQDIGTDFVTFARDVTAHEGKEGAWDIGAPVFLQIKGSRDWYRTPSDGGHGKPGWWFAEANTYHFDHWLSLGLPYLLVLVDVTNQVGYWAEVTGQAIVDTGKGRKIFVPAAQTVDAHNLEALNRVAVSRRRYDLEGAVWEGRLNDLAPADRLRNALLLPRLVAPHPNRSPKRVTFEEAVAMVMRNRISALTYRASKGLCPKPDEWETHKDWGWRFVHALSDLVKQSDSTGFSQLTTNARHPFEKDACLIIEACAEYTDGNVETAFAKLVPDKSTKPADLGWLHTQRASFLLELDKPAEAGEAAKEALFALRALDGDPTVSVIRGGAAWILFTVADHTGVDVGAAVTAQDNAGTWWRAQEISWALEKDLTLRFRGWTEDGSMHFNESTAADDLSMVGWNAAFSGSWGSWRHLAALRAQLALTSTNDLELCLAALLQLVFIGEKRLASSAVRKIWLDGPAESLHALVRACAERPWGNRDEGPTMAAFSQAGDLLDYETADHVVQRIIDLVNTQGDIRDHAGAWSNRWNEIDVALHRVLAAASSTSHEKVADLIASRFGTCDESVAHSLLRVANALETRDFAAGHLIPLFEAARTRGDHYAVQLLEILAHDHPDARADLKSQANAGNENAIRSLLVAGSTDQAEFLALGRKAAITVREMMEDAAGKDGTTSMTVYMNDPLDDLTFAAIATNDEGLWTSVTDVLEAGIIDQSQQHRAVRRLASCFKQLPLHVQQKMRALAPDLQGSSLGLGFGGGSDEFDAAVTQLRVAAGVVADIEVEVLLLNHLRANPVGCAQNLVAWNSASKLPFLATLVFDSDPRVRSQAGFGIVEHVHRFPDDADRGSAFIRSALAQEKGYALADGIAHGLAAYPEVSLGEVDASLRSHPSALVRKNFRQGHS